MIVYLLIENCNYVVDLGRKQKFSLVGIAGKLPSFLPVLCVVSWGVYVNFLPLGRVNVCTFKLRQMFDLHAKAFIISIIVPSLPTVKAWLYSTVSIAC